MKENKKLTITIIAVVSIIVLIGGSTFAYWTWVSDTGNQTNVNFSLKNQTAMQADLYANLNGNGTTTITELKPTTCNNSDFAVVKTVPIKYKNATTQNATITATLKVTAFTLRNASYVPTPTNLGFLKFKLTTSQITDCNSSTGVVKSGSFSAVLFGSDGEGSNLPVTLFSQTFTAPANMTAEATQTYYLYIWLDSTYTHTNTGSVNSDPMQGFSVTTQWSGDITQTA